MLIQDASGTAQFFQPAGFSGGSEHNIRTSNAKTVASAPTEYQTLLPCKCLSKGFMYHS